MSNITEIKINWVEQEGKVNRISSADQTKLTNDDLLFIKSKLSELDEMLAQLRNKIGNTKKATHTVSNKEWYNDKSLFQKCIC